MGFELINKAQDAERYNICPACNNVVSTGTSRTDSTLEIVGGGYYKCKFCGSLLKTEL